jgi:predicted AAA+ superfamily ATPase
MTALKRNLENKINDLLKYFPVVVIIGTRQCGKTSLAKKLRPTWKYFDLEKASTYDRVARDITFFFQENNNQLIIDEAQNYPQIFNELRGVIDSDRSQNGRFIITGSSSPEILKQTADSLAGRVAIVELAPFKANELFNKDLSAFYEIINAKLNSATLDSTLEKLKRLSPICSHEEIKIHFLKGGYPEAALAEDDYKYSLWMESFYATYINRDIRSLFPKLDLVKFRRFTLMLAALSGQIINKSNLARGIEVSDKTIKDYLDIAHGTFVWRIINAFTENASKSLLKMPKGGFRDSGLVHYLKKINTLDELDTSPSIGHDFEQYVIEEIIKGISASKITNWDYSFYRTKGGSEIDLILKGPFGVLPIEIKYGTKVTQRSLTSLKVFLKQNELPLAIVVNNAPEVMMLSHNIIQIPIQYL